jgi:hypothetical protein
MTTRKPKILTRHNAASHNEFLYYATGIPMRQLCRILQRHERTVKTWIDGKAVIPPWAVAVLRLRALEFELMRDQMGLTNIARGEPSKQPRPAVQHRRPAANEQQFAVQLRLDIA